MSTPEAGAPRRARRLAGLVAKVVAVVVAVAVLAAAAYEQIAAWRDSRVLTQIGRSVDIGGRTLNIHCTGEGTPTVVFVSGPYGAWLHLNANPARCLRVHALMLVRPRGRWVERSRT